MKWFCVCINKRITTKEKIKEFVSKLGEIKFCNIEIKPFEIEIDSFKFGLIPNETSGMIELQPSSTITFGEPWDGGYDT